MADGPLVAKVGNVTKPPELRFSKAGKPFVKVSIAVNPYVPEGEPKPPAQYYEVTAFGTRAQNIAESVHKGHRVGVIGTGKLETWTGQDGKERTTKTILADFLGPDLLFVTAVLHRADGRTTPVSGEPEYAKDEEPF